MIKCPFCGYANEDGSAFCEQCKTDLAIPSPEAPVAIAPTVPGDILNFADEPPKPVESVPPGPTQKLDEVPIVPLVQEAPAPMVSTDPPAVPAQTPPAEPITASAIPTSVHPPPTGGTDAPVAKPALLVIRGEKIDLQYRVYPGKNYLGRTDDKPVDIDLENQEPADRIWTSRQHAVITFENGTLTIEDLNSLNGTFVNRTRVYPGQVKVLAANDVIQVGTVQLKVVFL